jgi:N-ethylmaleimide reductase
MATENAPMTTTVLPLRHTETDLDHPAPRDPMTATADLPPVLWKPTTVGAIPLEHRVAMAPMTRSRATAEGVPTELAALYYAQRASHALIISEGTQPSPDGQGYLLTPGLHNDDQTAGWRGVTDAVHAGGGRIVVQLMHVGRIAHPENTPHGRQPVAPSAVRPAGAMFTAAGLQEMPEPRALMTSEIDELIDDFRLAARRAIDAGADGVEIHGANGYLVHQFLSSNANQRTDRYGGSVANRIRFAVEVAEAVAQEIGADHTGIRISPGNPFNDLAEHDTEGLYAELIPALGRLDLAYLNLTHPGDEDLAWAIRRAWPTALLLNRPGATIGARAQDVESGLADVITVGVMALANPDLIERLQIGAPLNSPDPSTFYGGGEHGYTDYPALRSQSLTYAA